MGQPRKVVFVNIVIGLGIFVSWVRFSVWVCEAAGRQYVAWRLKRAS